MSAQSESGPPVLRLESKLVVVRVMVADKRAWQNGPNEKGQHCALAAWDALPRLSATEPYLPSDCEGIYIRGLGASDFHLIVDGKEQKIESVTAESDGLWVRDNLGLHAEHSLTPRSIWSSTDGDISKISSGDPDYGFLARNRYDIAFTPRGPLSIGCHKIKVKVDRRHSIVAAREDYCASESPSDILSGSSFGNQLDENLASEKAGEIPLALQAAVFEGQNGLGSVRIALEFPMRLLYRQWNQNWVESATIGVLGTIYRHDGTLASRFSDFACCTPYSGGEVFGAGLMTMNDLNQWTRRFGIGSNVAMKLVASVERASLPSRYETLVDLPPGDYDLKVVLSDGKKFGRAESHFKVVKYDPYELGLSSVMLCNRYRDAHVAEIETKAANFAPQYVPIVSKGVQFNPVGATAFSPSENLIAYFEIYDSQAIGSDIAVQAHIRVVDAKTGGVLKDFPAVDATTYEKPGSTVIPIAREVPIANLPKGQYRIEVQASDVSGRKALWHATAFSIE